MSYYTAQEAQGGMAILAGWLGKNYKVKVVYHDKTAIDANVEQGIIRIPKLACASGLTEEAIQLLRSMIYHESGHIAETFLEKSEKPKGALFSITNALEDRRIERVLSDTHLGCKSVFSWATDYYNKRISGQIASGKANAPLWEALCAMGIQYEGLRPAWRLTPKAEAYFKAAYDEFSKVRDAKNTKDCLEIAKRIYALLEKVSDDFKKEQNKQEEEKQEKQKEQKKQEKQGKQEKQEKGEEGSQAKDMPDEDDNDSDESKKDKKESKKSDKKDKGKDKDDKKDDDKGSDEDGEESDKDKKDGKDSDESDENDGEDSDGEGSDEDDEEGESKGKGKKDDDSDGDESGEEGSDDGDESEGAEGSDEEGDSDSESNGLEDDDNAKDSDEDSTGDNDVNSQEDTPYHPSDIEDGDTDKAKEQGKTELEDECGGQDQREILNECLDELFSELTPEDKEYLACRDNDEHVVPPENANDRHLFIERRGQIGSAVSAMTRALEQALRAMAKCRKDPYLRQGKIDKKRMVAITKSLSKEVFCKIRQGTDLNVAVEILIDESGSMGNWLDVQLVAIAIGEALSQIDVPFEITGTTTKGGGSYNVTRIEGFSRTNPLLFKHYKSFDENWIAVRHRIVNTRSLKNNVDGETVEFAAYRLAQRKESRKIIFSLSDGEPCAGQNNDPEMCMNLKRVCERVRKNGIEVYGFGIGTEAPRAFYGKNFFVYLDRIDQMGQDFVRKLADVITYGKVKV